MKYGRIKQIAKQAGIPYHSLQMILSGKRKTSLHMALLLQRETGRPWDTFVSNRVKDFMKRHNITLPAA